VNTISIKDSVQKLNKPWVVVVAVVIVLLFPNMIGEPTFRSFNNLKEYLNFHRIQYYHGPCAVASDFSHFIRAKNGERCALGKEFR